MTEIPGYDYGTARAAHSPMTLAELRELEGTVGWTEAHGDAIAQADKALAGRHVELVEQAGPKARLAIVDPARLIEHDQRVMVNSPRICTLCRPVLGKVHRTFDPPWPRSNEALAWDIGKGVDHRLRAEVGGEAQLFCMPRPIVLTDATILPPRAPTQLQVLNTRRLALTIGWGQWTPVQARVSI